jgi:chemotaxis protein MotB
MDKTFWMVTFSDLLSLMLTFFVLLLSMSTMSKETLQRLNQSFGQGVGIFGRSGPFGIWIQPEERPVQRQVLPPWNLPSYRQQSENMQEVLKAQVEKLGPSVHVGTDPRSGNLQLTLDSSVLFPSGAVELSGEAREVLRKVGESLRHVDGRLHVEGHSDDVPINGEGPRADNWALSLARAISVASYWRRELHLNPARLSVTGYGPAFPVASNETAEGRAKNRRITVEVVR